MKVAQRALHSSEITSVAQGFHFSSFEESETLPQINALQHGGPSPEFNKKEAARLLLKNGINIKKAQGWYCIPLENEHDYVTTGPVAYVDHMGEFFQLPPGLRPGKVMLPKQPEWGKHAVHATSKVTGDRYSIELEMPEHKKHASPGGTKAHMLGIWRDHFQKEHSGFPAICMPRTEIAKPHHQRLAVSMQLPVLGISWALLRKCDQKKWSAFLVPVKEDCLKS
eukprot:gnl/MRDRNA2_/MRDRNA2_182467_c0_seq1.p1 gnl/MRDRNA2_/MRDRNA2_182467_c0~~gnl/MRDRNA2_/MRDRNA2_182467_c0_seq1.p1  ORF type:complete len:224 (+),score=30.12 gnl/MRDRNA2_/MRDRNA2_182467_c0_seq1:156-827(+)